MAISNTSLLQLPLLAFIITVSLMLLSRVNAENSLSFKFEKFSSDQHDLILQGTATVKKNVLKLTDSGFMNVGRALFYAPVHLWESPEVVASFETNFTFSISSTFDAILGDGLAFFIANPNSQIPPNSAGEFLGLWPDPHPLQNSTNKEITSITDFKDKVVAVEFDTFPNPEIGDPYYNHIGIDVNSITSKKTTKWDWQNGKIANACISYNSVSEKLTVVTSYPGSDPVTLSYDIALNTVLPKWVRVGFSGSTGLVTQTNSILSWSFSSHLVHTKVQNQKEDIYIASVV